MSNEQKRKGIFYAVSTGPGDPDMMTKQAVDVLNKCEVIFYPCTAGGKPDSEKTNISYDTAEDAVDIRSKTLIQADFSMSRDAGVIRRNYESVAGACLDYLVRGIDVAFISLGDVSLYSTAASVASIVKKQGHEIVFIPGVTSVSAAACACALDVAGRDTPVTLIPGDALFTSGMLMAELESPGTKIIMKSGRHLDGIIKLIHAMDMEERCFLVQNCSMPSQKIYSGAQFDCLDADVFSDSYLSVLIVLEKNTSAEAGDAAPETAR